MHLSDESQSLLGREAVEQREILRHDSDPPFDGDRVDQRIDSEDAHGAGRGRQQARQTLDRRRFARAVRTEESVETAGGDREIDS